MQNSEKRREINDRDYDAAGQGDHRWAVKLSRPLQTGATISEDLIKCQTKPHAQKLASELKEHGAHVVDLHRP